MTTTSERGNSYERRFMERLSDIIAADEFVASPRASRLFHRKGYYSRDRDSEIITDVSVEAWLPDANEWSVLVVIECKDLQRRVDVSDVEEFHSKLKQIADSNSKGIVVSTAGFRESAISYARAKGIGLIVWRDEPSFKWVLRRATSTSSRTMSTASSYAADLALMEPTMVQHEFFGLVGADFKLGLAALLRSAMNESENANRAYSGHDPARVPFVAAEAIGAKAWSLRLACNQTHPLLELSALCRAERDRSGLVVQTVARPTDEAETTLGRISFDENKITVYQDLEYPARERFTLAHELGHHFMGHGSFLRSEYTDEHDQVESPIGDDDIGRLEYQANEFASQLLMPEVQFIQMLVEIAEEHDLVDRGFGHIYLDAQPVNRHIFLTVSTIFMETFAVSRSLVRHRLKRSGFLREPRTPSTVGPVRLGQIALSRGKREA